VKWLVELEITDNREEVIDEIMTPGWAVAFAQSLISLGALSSKTDFTVRLSTVTD
jgi:hypothetical protein